MDHVECIVVGAGVVGLAVARALSQAGRETIVLEAAGKIGTGVSSRNSEVIHAGIYYPPQSLKARLCVRGNALLHDFCAAAGVPSRRCGKLVVATRSEDEPKLDEIDRRAAASGVRLQRLTGAQARQLEPALNCSAALLSPTTGIVDSHALMVALQADAEAHGAAVALASPFAQARRAGSRWIVGSAGAEPFELEADWIVNCAALDAQKVARSIEGFPAQAIPARWLAKGHYFALAGRAPFSRLIYPVPVDGGLGVHLTLDLGGQARFGPDVEWLGQWSDDAELDYAVDARRGDVFYDEVRRYWPELAFGRLQGTTTGIRPKLSGPGEPAADFRIDGPAQHGVPGVVQLFGIESPGLTASIAIAEMVGAIVEHEA